MNPGRFITAPLIGRGTTGACRLEVPAFSTAACHQWVPKPDQMAPDTPAARRCLAHTTRSPVSRVANPWLSCTSSGSYCPRCAHLVIGRIHRVTDTAKRSGLGSLRAAPTRRTTRTVTAPIAKETLAMVGHPGQHPARAHRWRACPWGRPTLSALTQCAAGACLERCRLCSPPGSR
jgi:hypothetical protein